MTVHIVETARLRLEPFAPSHRAGLCAMDSDPQLMRYIGDGQPKPPADTDAAIARVQTRWADLGYSWWSLFLHRSNEVIGAACVQNLANQPDAPLEIGWRLRPEFRGQGYATEAGRAAVNFAFDTLGARYLMAVAHPENLASHRVMQRLGMTCLGIQTHYDQPCTVYERHRPTI
ncbi:GNAT family N-acetyltransferase [Puniceibacterium sp. IMCC21224]|uniref:GNAT family N-acetyltransferase n=1 Tax=Puniceibacterium sp. IMCC21224 TaxID=1618204 RepID=UPI00064E031C|nr:GNAT family N-acetyltransferase [Puniceibacterium sp. IMCC21224]KMK68404.1 acetyltransferase, ribosomal protein N-acetylase [Puniceibacterium sp. IMCC21224]